MIHDLSEYPFASAFRVVLVDFTNHQFATEHVVWQFSSHFAFVFTANVYPCLCVVKREVVMIASILFNNLSIVPYFGLELLGN